MWVSILRPLYYCMCIAWEDLEAFARSVCITWWEFGIVNAQMIISYSVRRAYEGGVRVAMQPTRH
jgi:hypothetical protein